MMVAVIIDPASPDWPYVQLADQLRARIERGELGPRLPSIMALSQEAGVSTRTMQRAIDLLKKEKVVYTVAGRGTFVTRPN
jgi:DNA-binding GntR family transcriptional regulator